MRINWKHKNVLKELKEQAGVGQSPTRLPLYWRCRGF